MVGGQRLKWFVVVGYDPFHFAPERHVELGSIPRERVIAPDATPEQQILADVHDLGLREAEIGPPGQIDEGRLRFKNLTAVQPQHLSLNARLDAALAEPVHHLREVRDAAADDLAVILTKTHERQRIPALRGPSDMYREIRGQLPVAPLRSDKPGSPDLVDGIQLFPVEFPEFRTRIQRPCIIEGAQRSAVGRHRQSHSLGRIRHHPDDEFARLWPRRTRSRLGARVEFARSDRLPNRSIGRHGGRIPDDQCVRFERVLSRLYRVHDDLRGEDQKHRHMKQQRADKEPGLQEPRAYPPLDCIWFPRVIPHAPICHAGLLSATGSFTKRPANPTLIGA